MNRQCDPNCHLIPTNPHPSSSSHASVGVDSMNDVNVQTCVDDKANHRNDTLDHTAEMLGPEQVVQEQEVVAQRPMGQWCNQCAKEHEICATVQRQSRTAK